MKKRKHFFWPLFTLGVIFLLIIGVVLYGLWWIHNIDVDEIISSDFVQEQIVDAVGEQHRALVSAMPELLGFNEPKTYLLLFLNNTELRPGGGFIGSYATIRVVRGEVEVLAIEGSEELDRRTPEAWKPAPPAIMQRELGVDRWYFRDANWSPDWQKSTEKILEFYAAEGGVVPEDIDMVVGVTPTVLEELLKIMGEIDVDGMRFDAANVTEKLQYEAEFGYEARGVAYHTRKEIIGRFFAVLVERLEEDMFVHTEEYLKILRQMFAQKQVVIAPQDDGAKELAEAYDWNGEVVQTAGDYLLWVDANLAALKTDHAMERSLLYTLQKQDNEWVATADMNYVHTGGFDWRTTRYRTYARVFVPEGATLRSVRALTGAGPVEVPLDQVDQGKALGKQWFGVFFVIEPGTRASLAFEYTLPDAAVQPSYTLDVQKQIGTQDHGLLLKLDFDSPVRSATPGEPKEKWGDDLYEIQTDLLEDRRFTVSF